MSQFVTVNRNDSQFWPMLTGKFSKTHFAQPIRTLYVKSKNEQVTFKIIERSQSSLLTALVQWYSLARNIYLVFPIMGGLALLFARYGALQWDLVAASVVCLQLFLMALTLYSDYHDYINGIDRINEHNFKKPLLKGIIRPYQAVQLAGAFLGLSLVLAAYLFWQQPMTLFFAAAAFAISYLFSSSIFGQKFKGYTSLMSFFLAGPLLILGLEYLLFSQLSFVSIVMGLIYGLHALKYDYCKQLRDIFYNSKAQVVTFSTSLGFEKSKYAYSLISLTHLVFVWSLARVIDEPMLYLLLIVGVGFEIYINRLLYGAASFLSANVTQCMDLQKLHFTIENFLLICILLSPLWI